MYDLFAGNSNLFAGIIVLLHDSFGPAYSCSIAAVGAAAVGTAVEAAEARHYCCETLLSNKQEQTNLFDIRKQSTAKYI